MVGKSCLIRRVAQSAWKASEHAMGGRDVSKEPLLSKGHAGKENLRLKNDESDGICVLAQALRTEPSKSKAFQGAEVCLVG